MPKYLLSASYSPEGLKGLQKDKASGRVQAAQAAIEGLGGRVEAAYFALGEDDMYVIVDMPDNVAVSALTIATLTSGRFLRGRTTALLTVEEVDRALEKSVNYP